MKTILKLVMCLYIPLVLLTAVAFMLGIVNGSRVDDGISLESYKSRYTSARVVATWPVPPRYQAAADYAEAHNGIALLILEGDRTVRETYRFGYKADTPFALYSGTKSFACALAVAAAGDGLLDLDEPVADTITGFRSDPGKAQITVRQLLNFTSGIGSGGPNLARAPDKYLESLNLPMMAEPGERFHYGSSDLLVFGEVMRRKLAPEGEDLLDYLQRRVFDSIGLEPGAWQRDGAGNPYLATGAYVSASAWSRYGQLIRDGGEWEGEQILSEALLQACFTGSEPNPAYGLTFWLNRYTPEESRTSVLGTAFQDDGYLYKGGPPDLVMAAGSGNQRLYIIPSRDLVVVRFGWNDPTWADAEFLAHLLEDRASE